MPQYSTKIKQIQFTAPVKALPGSPQFVDTTLGVWKTWYIDYAGGELVKVVIGVDKPTPDEILIPLHRVESMRAL